MIVAVHLQPHNEYNNQFGLETNGLNHLAVHYVLKKILSNLKIR